MAHFLAYLLIDAVQ